MQYMILIYGNETDAPCPTSEEEGLAMMKPWMDYTDAMKEAGVLVSGEALQPTPTATTVRVRGGETMHTDGPFAETKEQLGGYYLIECADLDEALKWAARCPGAIDGACEVRPVVKFD
ncbi:MAG: YciI family protein [Myxococcota bacterium]